MDDIKLAMLAERLKPVPCPWCRGTKTAVKDDMVAADSVRKVRRKRSSSRHNF